MMLEEEIKDFTDEWGLVTHHKNKGPSGNGLLYTAWWVIILQQNGQLTPEVRAKYRKALQQCEVLPGLYKRHPMIHDHQGPDDYVGLLAVSRIAKLGLARRIALWGTDNCYNYNHIEPGKWRLKSWFGRMRQFVAHSKFAYGRQPSLIDKMIWCITVMTSAHASPKDQDRWTLTWLLIATAKDQSILTNFAARYFMKRMPAGGLSLIFAQYFTYDHPIAKHVKTWQY